MKLMIASDIHGSAYYCRELLEAWKREKPEKLVLLGDILYHGPRNDLPREYAPKEVIAMLNQIRQELLCVRGNCDTEVDQMVLEFPILADYAWFYVTVGRGEKRRECMMFVTHGHVFHEKNLPMLKAGDILLNGHTHVPACRVHPGNLDTGGADCSVGPDSSFKGADTGQGGFIYMNPGSVSIPKENSWHGYMTIEDGCFVWKDLSGTEQLRYEG